MRGLISIVLVTVPLVCAVGEERPNSVAVMSFNVRYDNPADGPNGWVHRKDWVAEIIGQHDDVAGLQEVRKNQLDDLKERLADFEFFGVGRDDGKEAGEFVPLVWKKDRFTATEKGVFWLSETPDEPSTGWDALLPRVATWARLRDKQGDRTILFVNTHFDHRGEEARRKSGELLRTWIAEHAKNDPVVLTGDFNTMPDSAPYQNILAATNGAALQDARLAAAETHGPESTWNGFTEVVPGRRIDFIFTSDAVNVTAFRTLDEVREGRFASDHLAIVAKLSFDK